MPDRIGVIHGYSMFWFRVEGLCCFFARIYQTQLFLNFNKFVVQWWCDWYLGLRSVTVQIYDSQNPHYHWKGCLINVTDAVSGLMSIYIHFWWNCDSFKSIQRHPSDISFWWSLRSRNIIKKRIPNIGKGVWSMWRMLWVAWCHFFNKTWWFWE